VSTLGTWEHFLDLWRLAQRPNPFPGFTHLSISLLLVVFILLLLSFFPSQQMSIEVSLNSSLIKPPVLVRGFAGKQQL
jgi:hypothetical protein